MTDLAQKRRFEELDAARALGDLTAEESRELQSLIESGEFQSDAGLDWIAATLEGNIADAADESLSDSLRTRIEADAAKFEQERSGDDSDSASKVSFWSSASVAWAVAACLAVAFLISLGREPGSVAETPPPPAEVRRSLITGGAVPLPFNATAEHPKLSGDVVWADDAQQGFMSLAGLPVNDPAVEQYQLWIVDPKRDTAPVDGGVFDIPAGSDVAIVPVRAALRVDQPVAFVITVEQPGGVVVSKQERVAGIAQRS